MTKKTASSDATAKPCPIADKADRQIIETPHGAVSIRSLHASLTRDAAQAVSAFFENERLGWPETLVIDPFWAVERINYDDGRPAIIIASDSDLLATETKLAAVRGHDGDLIPVPGDDPDFEESMRYKMERRLGVWISPSWSTATLLDDFGDGTVLVVSGPDAALVQRAGNILSAALDFDLASDSDEPTCDEDDVDVIDEDCEAVSAPSRKQPFSNDKDLDELVDAYNQLGATYSSYARALRTGDDEVADRLALVLTELEVWIERLDMPAFVSPEARAEAIFAIRDSKRNGRRR